MYQENDDCRQPTGPAADTTVKTAEDDGDDDNDAHRMHKLDVMHRIKVVRLDNLNLFLQLDAP